MQKYLGKWIIYDQLVTEDQSLFQEKVYTFKIKEKDMDNYHITKKIYDIETGTYTKEGISFKSFDNQQNLLELSLLEDEPLCLMIKFFSNRLFG